MSAPEGGVARLCFPLDYPTLAQAEAAAERLAPMIGVFKVGLELFVREGPESVRRIKRFGREVFLDLKLHDIPNTVAAAVASASDLEVDYLTVHTSGGPTMLEAAARRVEGSLTLLGVTVLTSLDDQELARVGVADGAKLQAQRLATVARDAGLRGLVCSMNEVAELRRVLGAEATLVTPGIRPSGADVGDQKRVGTPTDAIRAGSTLLVVGRPIRNAPDPCRAAEDIALEIDAALRAGAPA